MTAGRGLREVHPEEVLRVRAARASGTLHSLTWSTPVRRWCRTRRRGRSPSGCACRLAHHAEQRDEDRHLDQEGQATRQRVDLVLLVELHHSSFCLRLSFLYFAWSFLISGWTRCMCDHRLGLLGGEREQREHHDEREQDDRRAQVRDDAVEEREERAEEVVDGSKIEPAAKTIESALFRHVWEGRGSNVRSVPGPGRSRRRATGGSGRRAAWRARSRAGAVDASAPRGRTASTTGGTGTGRQVTLTSRQARIGSIEDAGERTWA